MGIKMGVKVYLDANQLYYIRRIAEEARGWEYGDSSWAYQYFKNDPAMIADIRALCYIVALQYEWELGFSTSDAAYTEVCQKLGKRSCRTMAAWNVFAEGIEDGLRPTRIPLVVDFPVRGRLNLGFIPDKADRAILRHFATEDADVFLTSDSRHILSHRSELARLGIKVMRPAEWLNSFLAGVRGNEDGVEWLERILFTVGQVEGLRAAKALAVRSEAL